MFYDLMMANEDGPVDLDPDRDGATKRHPASSGFVLFISAFLNLW